MRRKLQRLQAAPPWGMGPGPQGVWVVSPPPSVLVLWSKAGKCQSLGAPNAPGNPWGPAGCGRWAPTLDSLLKMFRELGLLQGQSSAGLQDNPGGSWLGCWGGHVSRSCRKRRDR